MEHLTKQQIVLLTLLVSFVSSIATGIVTVSLLDQAPPAVTQTINRVVERTIERVATASTSTPSVVRETIVVKDDQAVVGAITKASPSVVRVYGHYTGSSNNDYLGLGVIVSTRGHIIARVSIQDRSEFSAVLDGGNTVTLNLVSQDGASGLALFQSEQSVNPVEARAFTSAILGDSDGVKLGQSVIAIGGQEDLSVLSGVISSVAREGNMRPTGLPAVSLIRASITEEGFTSQSVLINLAGEVIGLKTGYSREDGYVPSGYAKDVFGKSF